MEKKLAIGLMTGSSMDGIDAAVLESDGMFSIKHIAGHTVDFTHGFRLALRGLEFAVQQEDGDLEVASRNFTKHLLQLCSEKDIQLISDSLDAKPEDITLEIIIRSLTMMHAKLVSELLSIANLISSEIEVIGFHGQNLYHKPPIKTIQVGDGQLLANETGITVINNFRENDVKNGGQGAPFAPLYHFALANAASLTPVAIVNCGGISNITLIYDDNPESMIAYDAGPGNVLIDRYIRKVTNNAENMDKDGVYGSKGKVVEEILPRLRQNALKNYPGDFLSTMPPKSLDTRHFELIDELDSLSIYDACATLEFFTAECIVSSLDLVDKSSPTKFVLAGGGWKNPVIYKYLKELLGTECEILHADDVGFSSQYMEAEIFAYLALRNLAKLPISLPSITGARRPTMSDNVYYPNLS